MTREEVLKLFNSEEYQDIICGSNLCDYKNTGCGDCKYMRGMHTIADVLTPKKPNYKGYCHGEFVYNTWVCPNCGKDYEVNLNHYKYCPECGQAIDWSNDVKKTYSKDYFEGMKKFADIVLGELGSVAEYYDDMSRTLGGSHAYKHREKGIDEAMDIINAVLHLQLEAEEDKPEVDWSQVVVNTPILVRDFDSDIWQKRYFAKYENGIVNAWIGGSTSWTETGMKSWNFAKLEEEEE